MRVLLAMIPVLLVACGSFGPQIEIVGVQAQESFGFDYAVHVDCTIKNNGNTKDVTVGAELSKGGWWKKERTVRLQEGESQTVRITFSEPTFLSGGISDGEFLCEAK